MSIDTVNDLTPRVQYEALAAQTDFDYTFPIFDDADLVVYVDSAVQALDSDYTVSGAGDDTGGTITFAIPLVGGEIVTIYRDIAIARDTDISQNGQWLSSAYNDEQDKIFLILQQLEAQLARSLRIPIIAAVDDDELELDPANFANMYLMFDADGKPTPATLSASTMTQAIIGQLLYPRTQKEINATVVPTFYNYQELNLLRYGGVGDDSTNNATAFANVIAVAINGDKVVIPTGTYRTNASLSLSTGVTLLGDGMYKTIIKYTGSAASIIKMANTASSNSYVNILDLAVLPANASDICIDFKSVSTGVIERCRMEGGTSYATRKATGVRFSAAANSCYQNMVQNCFMQFLTEGVAVEDAANENRIFGGAILSCGTGLKTRGTMSDSIRVEFVRFENCGDAVNIHDFRDYLFIGNRFEKNADGLRGVVVAGGTATFSPLVLMQNYYASYAAGNDVVTSGLTGGKVRRAWEDNLEYDDLLGGRHFGILSAYLGNPASGTEPAIVVEGLNANMNLVLTPKGTGSVFTSTSFFAPKLLLTDGIAAPTTIGGAAQIYVDAADGDLKVKFGDGVVKTIVVDT